MNARISLGTMAALAVAGVIALAGCGDSDKPAYCSDRSDLQDSVNGLPDAAKSGNLDTLRSQIETIRSDKTTRALVIPRVVLTPDRVNALDEIEIG